MARGKVLDLTPHQRVDRAITAFHTHRFVQYSLREGQAGGFDPSQPDCGSRWSTGTGRKVKNHVTSDCIGFALWAYGVDRFQKDDFPLWGGWMNTNSLVAAANDPDVPQVKRLVGMPTPGCLLVYPSARPLRWYGHIGMYVGYGLADGVRRVVHCHGPRLRGPAISADPVEKFLKVSGCVAIEIRL
jgi:hypothetical protein